jgi:hypothetical protein
MTGRRRLPESFADLERFAEAWCLPSESERYAKRLASSMAQMNEFYDAFSPRLEDAITYCDQLGLDELPDDAEQLLQLIYSLIMVAMSIEVFSQPKAVNAADAWLERVREPAP